LDQIYIKCFPSLNRNFNNNFVRLYLNLFNSITEKSISNLFSLKGLEKQEIQICIQKYLTQSLVLNEINYSQKILAQRNLHDSQFPSKKLNFDLNYLISKLKNLFFTQRQSVYTKFAFLNFDNDFLLDLLLFRLK
jgi:hypothetical protein